MSSLLQGILGGFRVRQAVELQGLVPALLVELLCGVLFVLHQQP